MTTTETDSAKRVVDETIALLERAVREIEDRKP